MSFRVTFVTGNANKLREVKAILEPGCIVYSSSLDLEEIQGSIKDVAESKCRRASEMVRQSTRPALDFALSCWA